MAEVVIASVLSFLNVADSFHIDADVIPKNTYVRLFGDRWWGKCEDVSGESSPKRILDKTVKKELDNLNRVLLGRQMYQA
jgi:hypothetical protein